MMRLRYLYYRVGEMQYARPTQRANGYGGMVNYHEKENFI